MLIHMKVDRIIIDPIAKTPILVLQEIDKDRVLPIWIGQAEAVAIAFELEDVKPPRPMTHDLAVSLVNLMGGRISRIIITSLRDNTYHAELVLEKDGEELTVDSRPSDAVALALRTDAPVLVEEQVIVDAHRIDITDAKSAEESEKWKEFLENLDDEDFGKYKM